MFWGTTVLSFGIHDKLAFEDEVSMYRRYKMSSKI